MIFVDNNGTWIPVDVDAHVVHESSGLKTFDFQIAVNDPNYIYFKNEVTVRCDGLFYKVKCDSSEDDIVETIECYLDRDDFKATMWNHSFYSESVTLSNCVAQILPAGWTHVDTSLITSRHTIDETENDVNALEILENIANEYGCVFDFDNVNKVLTSINPENTGYKGFYIIDDLNSAGITYTSDTYEFCTRIYGYGAYVEQTDSEGEVTGGYTITFADINNGKTYVEDKTYADVTISKTIRDERFTDPESLLAYCQSELALCAHPQVSYEIVTVNLSKLDPTKYNLFAYQMHDLIKYIDRRRGVEVYERIIKYEYTQNHPELDVITLSQASVTVTDSTKSLQSVITNEAQKTAAAVSNYAAVQLNLAKAEIYDLVVSHLEADYIDADTIDANYAHVTNGVIDNANINHANVNDLSTNYAHLTNGVIDNASISYANVNNLDTHYADIDFANVTTAEISEAWIKALMVQGQIITQSGTAYYLDAIHINANYIDAGTLKADRLLLTTDEGLYYQINLDTLGQARISQMTAAEQAQLRTTIHADAITAHTITSEQLTVNNIVGTGGWINLANGTFNYRNVNTHNGISWDGQTLSIQADSFILSSGTNIATEVSNIQDAIENGDFDGEDATVLRIDSTRGNMFKNNNVSTVLNVTIFSGPDMITTYSALTAKYGSSAYLQWYWQRIGETTFYEILSTDTRLSNNGFSLTLTPSDVDTKVTFMCKLMV